MTAFDTLHGAALDGVILPQFAETVTYTPKGGSAVSISAIVLRDPVSPAGLNMPRRAREIVVSKTDVPTVNTGGDTVSILPMPDSAATVPYRIGAIAESHAGGWRLLLEY